jgi:D-aminopeptidase
MSDMMSNEQFMQNSESESEYEQEQEDMTTDTESVESPIEEEDIDEIIYNDLLHLAILVKNIPKDELPQRMETIKGIATGEIVLKTYVENDNSGIQLFSLIMTLLVILMAIIIGVLIETKMDFFNLQKFM